MAEINKLSVGKVLDKLRSNDAQKTTQATQLNDKREALDEEVRRMRAASARLKRSKSTDTTGGG